MRGERNVGRFVLGDEVSAPSARFRPARSRTISASLSGGCEQASALSARSAPGSALSAASAASAAVGGGGGGGGGDSYEAWLRDECSIDATQQAINVQLGKCDFGQPA